VAELVEAPEDHRNSQKSRTSTSSVTGLKRSGRACAGQKNGRSLPEKPAARHEKKTGKIWPNTTACNVKKTEIRSNRADDSSLENKSSIAFQKLKISRIFVII
jgi:hypothetical protein